MVTQVTLPPHHHNNILCQDPEFSNRSVDYSAQKKKCPVGTIFTARFRVQRGSLALSLDQRQLKVPRAILTLRTGR